MSPTFLEHLQFPSSLTNLNASVQFQCLNLQHRGCFWFLVAFQSLDVFRSDSRTWLLFEHFQDASKFKMLVQRDSKSMKQMRTYSIVNCQVSLLKLHYEQLGVQNSCFMLFLFLGGDVDRQRPVHSSRGFATKGNP